MHLITPLAAGIVGAESGTVAIYRRGTTTRATYYTDFEASDSVTPTANVSLDSSGRLIAYVNQVVTCVVYNSSGSAVTTFTCGDSASAVEVVSQSFTGTDYETALSAASEPVNLSTVMDLWYTNNGALDWKVLVGGVSKTIQAAMGSIAGLVYNVMDSTYGATGDGTTNDRAAIQAAITAANAAGGGIVWLPEGTYRITSALTLSDKVSLAGAGSNATTISIDHASANAITVSGSTTRRWQDIFGMRIIPAQANSGRMIEVGDGSLLRVIACHIGDGNQDGKGIHVVDSSTTVLLVHGCRLTCSDDASSVPFNMAGGAKRVTMADCDILSDAAQSSAQLVYGRDIDIDRCRFNFSALAAGTVAGFKVNSNTFRATVHNCIFTADAGGTTTALSLGTPTATAVFDESGNQFLCDTAYSCTTTIANWGMQINLGSRRFRTLQVNQTTNTLDADTLNYGEISVLSTYAGNVTITATMIPFGNDGTIAIYNDDGSPRSFTPDPTSPFLITGAKSITNDTANIMHYYGAKMFLSAAGTPTATAYLVNTWIS